MRTQTIAGIIAEYNPFHNGHSYQIAQIRKHLHPDYIVVVMSGDFVQRGAPALMDKDTRAKMCLLAGADLVLELPVAAATGSASCFAMGAVDLLRACGVVTHLCFGAETDDLPRMQKLAEILCQEPHFYRQALKKYLKEGYSFPAARALALPDYADLLRQPNNILAVSYLAALHSGSTDLGTMKPVLIPRIGANYHGTNFADLSDRSSAPRILGSAEGIRTLLFFGQNKCSEEGTADCPCDSLRASACGALFDSHAAAPSACRALFDSHAAALSAMVPDTTFRIMKEYEQSSAFLREDDFSLLLAHCLLRETRESLLMYRDFDEALANRVLSLRPEFTTWSRFCELLKTKNTTYTGISRALTHLLLGLKKDTVSQSGVFYLRVLGFRKEASPLLIKIKECAGAPLLTTPADAGQILCLQGLAQLQQDLYAADLYRTVLTARCGHAFPNEYRKKLLIL